MATQDDVYLLLESLGIDNLQRLKPGTNRKLAEMLDLTPSQLTRRLQKEGVTLQAIVTDFRTIEMKRMLAAKLTNAQINRVMRYSHIGGMLAAFKRDSGMSMTKYRYYLFPNGPTHYLDLIRAQIKDKE